MKLIPLSILLISITVVKAQKFRQDFPFPPQYAHQSPGIFSSDSTLYLPPESHTPIPYFPLKNVNSLQFPYLPPTGTKAPSVYPTPFPMIMSTSLVPNFDDDDDEKDEGVFRMSTSRAPVMKQNHTQQNSDMSGKENRETRQIPKMTNFQQPIDRIDIKYPSQPPGPASTPAPARHNSSPRSMLVNMNTHRNDLGLDQIKAGSFQGPFVHAPGVSGVYISSTTEPAIPIIRLSNEMDLDGSFSYEALGADQTHYVQHSHMENMGTDKEEQVVEGSYSYVGDNGQTYTVHYIADSNGFRASGDHLPVAPPIPEIIQRAVQYNLAEEAKRPPQLKSWQDENNDNQHNRWQNDGKDNQIINNDNIRFNLPPARNLFTGRAPEAFSYSYGSNTQNNLLTSASTQTPIKTIDVTTEQAKANNGPISPQVTFLASQGAHVPSINTVQNTIARMFTTEKPAMPQIVNYNYEAGAKDSDQEGNKGLWRWQYGINSNNLSQNQNRDTISRSFGEGDEVMINFNDMTSDQYTKMIHSQLESSAGNMAYLGQFYQGDNRNFGQETQNQFNSANMGEQSSAKEFQQQQLQGEHRFNNINMVQPAEKQQYLLHGNFGQEYHNQYQNLNMGQTTEKQQGQQKDIENVRQEQQIQLESVSMGQSAIKQQNLQSNSNNIEPEYQNQYHMHMVHDAENKKNLQKDIQNYKQDYDKNIRQDYQNHYYNANMGQSTDSQTNIQTEANTALPHADWYKSFQFSTTVAPAETRDDTSDIRSKILTQKDFAFPTQTVTQSYNFDENFYEPRKIKAINNDSIKQNKQATSSLNNIPTNKDNNVTRYNPWVNTNLIEKEPKDLTTQEPFMSTDNFNNIKFTDFIVNDDNKDDFKPIIRTTTEKISEEKTTTEASIEDIFNNNIFLKNFFTKPEINESKPVSTQQHKIIMDEPKTFVLPAPKKDKIPKFIQHQQKPINEIKTLKKKPLDISEILNFVTMKNHFESSKMKPRSKPIASNYDQRSKIRFIPIQQEINEESNLNRSEQENSLKTLEQQEEMKGVIKNYKVLQRNNNNFNHKRESVELKRELSPPPLQSPSLPPLGRAGPSMKTYLPPLFV